MNSLRKYQAKLASFLRGNVADALDRWCGAGHHTRKMKVAIDDHLHSHPSSEAAVFLTSTLVTLEAASCSADGTLGALSCAWRAPSISLLRASM